MDNPWLLALVIVWAISSLVYYRAWRISHEGGFPLFSRQTWEGLKIYVTVIVVLPVVVSLWYRVTERGKGDRDSHGPP